MALAISLLELRRHIPLTTDIQTSANLYAAPNKGGGGA